MSYRVIGRATTTGQLLPLGTDDPVIAARAVRRALADANRRAVDVHLLVVACGTVVNDDVLRTFARRALGPRGDDIPVIGEVSTAAELATEERLAASALGQAPQADPQDVGIVVAVGLAEDGTVLALCLASGPPGPGDAGYRPQTARETLARILDGTTPWVAIGDFLDDWQRGHIRWRQQMIEHPLDAAPDVRMLRWAAFIAAAVDQLAWQAQPRIVPPAWVIDPAYVLPEPWFLLPGWRLRMHQLVDTPAAFKRRNIYGGDRILSRA